MGGAREFDKNGLDAYGSHLGQVGFRCVVNATFISARTYGIEKAMLPARLAQDGLTAEGAPLRVCGAIILDSLHATVDFVGTAEELS